MSSYFSNIIAAAPWNSVDPVASNDDPMSRQAFPNKQNVHQPTALGANNYFSEFPAMMSDGRAFTHYNTESAIDGSLMERNGIQTNWQYRQFLHSNAENIIGSNMMEALREDGYVPYRQTLNIGNNNHPIILYNNAASIYKEDEAARRIGNTSDLRAIYLSSEDLNARRVAPMVSQDRLINHRNQQIMQQVGGNALQKN